MTLRGGRGTKESGEIFKRIAECWIGVTLCCRIVAVLVCGTYFQGTYFLKVPCGLSLGYPETKQGLKHIA